MAIDERLKGTFGISNLRKVQSQVSFLVLRLHLAELPAQIFLDRNLVGGRLVLRAGIGSGIRVSQRGRRFGGRLLLLVAALGAIGDGGY